jgi:hypothetical protein
MDDVLMNGWILTNCANGTQLPLHNAWPANNLSDVIHSTNNCHDNNFK